ncbi:MAG: fibronectin type III domain-containing protein [Microgenomates group bacterium]
MKHLLNKAKPYLLSLLVIASLAVIFIGVSRAADQTITCDATSGCTGSTGPLFEETNMAPLDTVTRTVTAQNNYPENRDFAVEIVSATFSDSTPSLAQILAVEVIEQESANTVYGPKTLEQWKTDDFVILSNVPTGGDRHYDFTVTMANVGNNYQGKTLVFDLNLGFDAFPPSPSPTPTTTPTPGPPGATPCTATVPTSAPVLSAFASSSNTVVLTWTTVSPVTHYTIRYGLSSGSYIYGAPDVGNVTSYVVAALSAGTTYYFQVAGVNDCMPGPWSNEASATPTGLVLGIATPAPPFEPLGVSVEKGVGEEEILGEEACADEYYAWWLPLVIQAILTFGYLWFIRKREEKAKRWWLIPIVLAMLSQIVHEILSCNCATGEWCSRYWLLNLAILIVLPFAYCFLKRRKK